MRKEIKRLTQSLDYLCENSFPYFCGKRIVESHFESR